MRLEGLVPVPEVGERGKRGNCSWVGGRLVQTLVPLHAVEERSMGTFFSPD